ncbi:sugar phosphate isomerase/epimerase family protein [Nonomuraea sp. NPDC050663]|uniref:sugar phosphate isomerase/epimerase family protein n=1 Tax=Nonomuraea sp. NPDC050663 TaxID=3364370 RepID=UPI0037AEFB09
MYAVQLYTLRDQSSLSDTLHRLAGLGYAAVEPFDILTDTAGLRSLLQETGLQVRSAHVPIIGERRQEVAEAAGVLGLDTVIVPFLPPDDFADAGAARKSAEAVNEAAAWGAEHGLRVGYHNHNWELAQWDAFLDALDPSVFLEVDVYWAHVGGADVPELLRGLGERVRFLHVKDGPANTTDAMTAVGDGVLPIKDILAAVPHAQRIVELDRFDGDMWDAVSRSIAYLREVEA